VDRPHALDEIRERIGSLEAGLQRFDAGERSADRLPPQLPPRSDSSCTPALYRRTAAGFEVAVEPVIVDLAAELTIKTSPDGVHVVAHTKAAHWLNHLPTRLPPDVVAQIFDVARRDTTWRGDTRHD
jgi:hypothetical protein